MIWLIMFAVLVVWAVCIYKNLAPKNAAHTCPFIGDSGCSGNCHACSVALNQEVLLRVKDRN